MRRYTLVALLCFSFVFSSCDSDGAEAGTDTSVKVSGALTDSFEGEAIFIDSPGAFLLTIYEGELPRSIGSEYTGGTVILSFGSGRPEKGEYTISTTPSGNAFGGGYCRSFSIIIGENGDCEEGSALTLGGEITISSSSENRVQGSFSFTGVIFEEGGSMNDEEVTVSGSFSATDAINP